MRVFTIPGGWVETEPVVTPAPVPPPAEPEKPEASEPPADPAEPEPPKSAATRKGRL